MSMLEIKNLAVEPADGGQRILNNVNLTVDFGYTNVLFGPNGSGKSALLRTIMGFSDYKVVEGRIFFFFLDVTNLSVDERAKKGLGIMLQRPPNMTGVKLSSLIKAIAKENMDIDKVAEDLDMKRFMDREINVGFSGGEIKRSELLQLIAQNPCMYLIDEPESGVDLVSINKVGTKIQEMLRANIGCIGERSIKGKSGLIITHTGQILDYLEADRGYIMCNGKIMCSGNPRELLKEIKSQGYEECIRCKLNLT